MALKCTNLLKLAQTFEEKIYKALAQNLHKLVEIMFHITALVINLGPGSKLVLMLEIKVTSFLEPDSSVGSDGSQHVTELRRAQGFTPARSDEA
ncbi:hypothetical protein M758_UG096900 [Ceratodon purpureus]|nr:hypothetical protein M758_UG096900 [Ceratodon purpureus]